MHFFALHEQPPLVTELLDLGADAFRVAASGDLPATTCATQRDWATAGLLLEKMERQIATDATRAAKLLRSDVVRRALYQLLAVLYEAPAAAGESSRAPALPDGVLAAVARLVGRAEATGDPPPFEPITYEEGGAPGLGRRERKTERRKRWKCGRRRRRRAAPSGTSSRNGDWSERRSAWRPRSSADPLQS